MAQERVTTQAFPPPVNFTTKLRPPFIECGQSAKLILNDVPVFCTRKKGHPVGLSAGQGHSNGHVEWSFDQDDE